MYVCKYVYTYICIHVCMYTRMEYMFDMTDLCARHASCMYENMYIHTYIYVCVYAYIANMSDALGRVYV